MIMPFDKKAYSRKSFRKGKVTPYKAKRGNLKPLMAEEQKSSANIQELQGSLCWACRSNFACRITRLFQYLTEDAEPMEQREQSLKLVCWLCRVVTEEDDSQYREYIFSKQIVRSGSSIGANVMEGQHAQSDADFLSKMQIALKEANETEYWLNLLHDNGYLNDNQYTSIHNDCVRILKILNTIVHTTRNKIGK